MSFRERGKASVRLERSGYTASFHAFSIPFSARWTDVNTEANIMQRVARLEGAYEHLATKADIQSTKAWIIFAAIIQAIVSAGISTLVALALRNAG